MKTQQKAPAAPELHVPGPWHIEVFGSAQNVNTICRAKADEHGGKIIATTFGRHRDATARLIAAAPELLAALEWMQKSMEEYQQAILGGDEITLGMTMRADSGIDKARAAIAGAKGEA